MSALQAFKHSLFLFVWTAKVMRSQSHRQNIPSLSSKRYFSESPFVHIMLKFTQYAYMDTYTPTQTDIMDLFLLHWRIWLKSNIQFANMIKAKNISHYSHCYSDIQTHNSLAEDLPTFSWKTSDNFCVPLVFMLWSIPVPHCPHRGREWEAGDRD